MITAQEAGSGLHNQYLYLWGFLVPIYFKSHVLSIQSELKLLRVYSASIQSILPPLLPSSPVKSCCSGSQLQFFTNYIFTKILLAIPAAQCSISGPCHMISDYKGTFDFRFFTARGTILTIDLSYNHKNESNSGTKCTLSFDWGRNSFRNSCNVNRLNIFCFIVHLSLIVSNSIRGK